MNIARLFGTALLSSRIGMSTVRMGTTIYGNGDVWPHVIAGGGDTSIPTLWYRTCYKKQFLVTNVPLRSGWTIGTIMVNKPGWEYMDADSGEGDL